MARHASAIALPDATVLASRVFSACRSHGSQSAQAAHTRMRRWGRTHYLACVLLLQRPGGCFARRLARIHGLGFASVQRLPGTLQSARTAHTLTRRWGHTDYLARVMLLPRGVGCFAILYDNAYYFMLTLVMLSL